ncbi:MAG: hypothetical protein RIC55_32330 [Pirellulaceae bacterium]
MVLTFGICSSICGLMAGSGCLCCLLAPVSFASSLPAVGFGIPAVAIGYIDLRAMKEGLMDETGRQMTMTGAVLGGVGLIAILLGVLMRVLWIVAASLSSAAKGV